MKKNFFSFAAVLLLCGACTANRPEPPPPEPPAGTKNDELTLEMELISFMHLLEFAREHYVDADEATYKKLFQGAMKGMLNHLDPFSNYDAPKDFSLMMDGSRGSFGGIGATLGKNEKGETVLMKVMPGRPADKAGLKKDDVILSVDGFGFQGKPLDECVGKIRGKVGTSAILKIRRGNDPDREFVVRREVIKTPSVTNPGILQDKIGYVKIKQFTNTTAKELDEFLGKYGKRMDRLIIDLRFNPGGQLDVTVEALSRFLEKGLLVVSVEGRTEGTIRHESIACKKYTALPIVVLINEHSASAAEIFSGCMKDYKRGTVVGMKSFGKGSVQKVFPMPDGGGVRITVAKYYTPSRNVIHGKGIEPDIAVKIGADEKKALAERFFEDDVRLPVVTEGKYRDSQLLKAIETVKGLKEFQMIR